MSQESVILFNYQNAMKQAKELKGISSKLKKLSDSQFDDTINKIDRSWDGESSTKFVQKGKKLKGKMDDSAKDLESIAGTIETIATNIYKAEMEALRIAKTRSHS